MCVLLEYLNDDNGYRKREVVRVELWVCDRRGFHDFEKVAEGYARRFQNASTVAVGQRCAVRVRLAVEGSDTLHFVSTRARVRAV